MNAPIRQGDVMLFPVAAIPAGTPETLVDGEVVLALGEATGHHHHIPTSHAATATVIRTPTDERFLRIVGAPAPLVHEEHATLEIAPGEYRVVIKREWTAGMGARQVID